MLKKDICQRCLEQDKQPWNQEDEDNWKKGSFACPCCFLRMNGQVGAGYVPVSADPPKACRMKLEYLVLNQVLE